MHIYKKSLPKLSRLVRYLADSNRRPRFCRPIPNHSGKVPFNYVESYDLRLQRYNFLANYKDFIENF